MVSILAVYPNIHKIPYEPTKVSLITLLMLHLVILLGWHWRFAASRMGRSSSSPPGGKSFPLVPGGLRILAHQRPATPPTLTRIVIDDLLALLDRHQLPTIAVVSGLPASLPTRRRFAPTYYHTQGIGRGRLRGVSRVVRQPLTQQPVVFLQDGKPLFDISQPPCQIPKIPLHTRRRAPPVIIGYCCIRWGT